MQLPLLLAFKWNHFFEQFEEETFLIGFILCVVGISLTALAKRISCALRHKDHAEDGDGIVLTIKIIGAILIVVAAILFFIQPR